MKSLRLIGLSLFAFLAQLHSSAFAQQSHWSGFYSGLSLGFVTSQSRWNAQSADVIGPSVPFTNLTMDATRVQNFNASGSQLSLFLGYNWQKENMVFGLEAELAALDVNASKAMVPGVFDCPVGVGLSCTNYSTAGDSTSVRLGANGSLRARLGFLVTPETLLYATSGLAIAGADISQTCQFSIADPL